MKDFLHKHKTPIAIGLFVVVVVPLCIFGLHKLFDQIAQKAEKIQQETATQESRAQRLSNLSQFRAQYDAILAEEQALDVFLKQTDDDKVALAKEIESIAEQTQNAITITTKDEQKQAPSKKKQGEATANKNAITPATETYLPLTITIEGQYADVVAFFKKIENVRYASDILSFSVESKKEPSSDAFSAAVPEGEQEVVVLPQNIVEATIDMVFYFQPEPKQEESTEGEQKRS